MKEMTAEKRGGTKVSVAKERAERRRNVPWLKKSEKADVYILEIEFNPSLIIPCRFRFPVL